MMTIATVAVPYTYPPEELAERGWRYETVTLTDGTSLDIQVPLTDDEFLHPKEGYHLPNSTFHDRIVNNAQDLLKRRYERNSEIAVFHDLLIEWDTPGMKPHSPDVCVVFGVRNKSQDRTTFNVVAEGVRPTFILEVVSPRYRKVDRETKVVQYAQAGVQEYVIIDLRRHRQITLDEVLCYRLVSGIYQPISPDDDGRVFCETVGLWISLEDDRLVMEDAHTGERLLNSNELENRVERLAEFLRSQGFDPDEVLRSNV